MCDNLLFRQVVCILRTTGYYYRHIIITVFYLILGFIIQNMLTISAYHCKI